MARFVQGLKSASITKTLANNYLKFRLKLIKPFHNLTPEISISLHIAVLGLQRLAAVNNRSGMCIDSSESG